MKWREQKTLTPELVPARTEEKWREKPIVKNAGEDWYGAAEVAWEASEERDIK